MPDPTPDPDLLADGTYAVEPVAEPGGGTDFTPVVELERVCLRCGYDLRGLAAAGLCPECGAPVINSLRGRHLRYSDPAFLTMLSIGARLVLAAFVLLVIGWAWAVVTRAIGVFWVGSVSLASAALGLGASICGLAGWWLISSPDPALRGHDPADRSRSVLRASLIVAAAGMMLSHFGGMIPVTAGGMFANLTRAGFLLGTLAGLVKFFAAMSYLARLAQRIPDEDLAMSPRFLRNVLVVIVLASIALMVLVVTSSGFGPGGMIGSYVVILATGVALLVWSLLYIAMLRLFGREIDEARRVAARIEEGALRPF